MLSLYEILKASKTGIAPDMWTALAGKNWGGTDSGHEVKELTGIPPLSFTADGTPLLDYLISGNTVQNGTGTPDSPVMPEGCGDLEATGEHAGQYKIPISNGQQTTNIYLGSTSSTRQIKKYICTGNEQWQSNGVGTNNAFFYIDLAPLIVSYGLSTHFTKQNIWSSNTVVGFGFEGARILRIRPENAATYTTTSFKQWLADQLTAGTPVTVWYVLATAETATVNEPLMKIGTYADTLSMEQAGVQIPTLHGNTVIDVETTLKPSEMYIKYQE